MELLSALHYYFTKLFILNSFQGLCTTTLVTLLAFFTPIAPLGNVFLFLVIFDLITGIMASKKRKEPIISRKLSRSIYKLFLYSLFLMVLYSLEIVLFGGIVPITKIGFGIVLMAEMKSSVENLDTIFDTNMFKGIFLTIKNLLNKFNKKDKE